MSGKSESAVSNLVQKGLIERGAIYVGTGLAAGALASLVLASGGRGTASRKAITAFGAGVGLGSAWTKTNMEIDDMPGK